MNNEIIYDVIVIGNGPGGISSSIYTARANKKTIIFTGPMWGGHLTTTTEVYNYTGYPVVDGLKLMENMMEQAILCGVEINYNIITKIIFAENSCDYHIVIDANGDKYKTKKIIIATGATHKHLTIEKSDELKNKGVYYCATCDGSLFANNDHPVIVVGGGNTALTEAIYLSGIVEKVILIHRRDEFRGEPYLAEKVKNTSNIEILYDTELYKLYDDQNKLISIDVINNKSKKIHNIKTNGIFIAIGFNPNTSIVKNTSIQICDDGYIITDPVTLATNIFGVYAVGDVTDKFYRQAIVAAGDGCKAAMNVIAELNQSIK